MKFKYLIEIGLQNGQSIMGSVSYTKLVFADKTAKDAAFLAIKTAVQENVDRKNDRASTITVIDDAGELCIEPKDVLSLRSVAQDVWDEFAEERSLAKDKTISKLKNNPFAQSGGSKDAEEN